MTGAVSVLETLGREGQERLDVEVLAGLTGKEIQAHAEEEDKTLER